MKSKHLSVAMCGRNTLPLFAYHPSLKINFIKESYSGKYMDRPDNDAVNKEIRILG
jgi:hypothetical protein